jgi:hypothetical protein
MAKKTTVYDSAIEYRVKFKKPHLFSARRTFMPAHAYYLMGDALAEIPPEIVLSAEPMPPMREVAP